MPEIFHAPGLIVQEFTVGSLQTHSYFLIEPQTKKVVVIDPGDDGDFLSEQILSQNLKLQAIVLTHGHFDHAGGTLPLCLNFPGTAMILPQKDESLYQRGRGSADYFGVEIDPLAPPTHLATIDEKNHLPQFSATKNSSQAKLTTLLPDWHWLFLPGHTPGHLGLYHPHHHLLISGDVIFTGGWLGRTDFRYSDLNMLRNSIKQNILPLPENTLVLPGHEELFTLDTMYRQNLLAALE